MTCLLLVAVVALLAATGVGAGVTWDMYPGDLIHDAIDDAEDGDMIYVHAGTYVENLDVDKRITLIGDGAGVVTGSSVIPRLGCPIESYPARI